MRTSIIATIIVLIAVNLSAQTDTTFYFKKNKILLTEQNGELKVQIINNEIDSTERILFEGNYEEESLSEVSFNFTFSKLIKKENNKKLNSASGQGLSLSFGTTTLSPRNLKNKNSVEGAVLSGAFDAGMTVANINMPLSKKDNWFFITHFGVKGYAFSSDNNTSFQVENGKTEQIRAPENIYYSRSNLFVLYLTASPMIEWNITPASQIPLFVQIGTDVGVRILDRSVVTYRENGKAKSETVGKKLNVNPFEASLRAGIGFGDFGIYAKYGLTGLFKQGKGADVIPVSFGFTWYFPVD